MALHPSATSGFNFKVSRNDVITLSLPDPFSFTETLHYLRRSPLEILHQVEGESVYKLLEVDGEKRLIEVSACQNGEELFVRFLDQFPADPAVVADYLAEWFDLRRDLNAFYESVSCNSILAPLIEKHNGLRVIGVPDLFEALCWAVIGQQVNLPFAYTVKKRFVEAYGEHLDRKDRRYWLFPKPERVAMLEAEDLRELQLTQRKAEYIISIANMMADGSLSKSDLLELEGDQSEKKLLAIRGIGPWSAHYVLMRCLRDPSAFPIGDAGLHNALKHILGREKKPTYDEIRKIFAPWQGWEAYAVFYLWRSLG
ncbi:DNA-3-methyladenine glycosylase [Pseudalkalibacillus sp. SCS-8]|uniref:DNA-3-methyladenine glycosylase 2 n=1 Tax=Pseudalkalibacillus nanhaiensis TaxID=3115291 RepID=UPI0032DB325D